MTAELRNLVATYAYALDELNIPVLEEILTEDTAWTFTIAGRKISATGREAVLGFVRDGHAAQARRSGKVRHHLDNVVVPRAEEVRAYLLQTRTTDEGVEAIATGTYTFGLRRSEDAWQIARLDLTLDKAP